MRRRVFKWIAVLVALTLLTLTASIGLADAGDFSGDTDWGGDSWDSGSDWGGGFDWGGDSDDWDDDSDSSWGFPVGGGPTYWDFGSDTYNDSYNDTSDNTLGYGRDEGGVSIFPIIVVVVIVLFVLARMKKQSGGTQVYTPSFEGAGIPIEELKKKDPNFSEEKILERVRNDYVRMQQAWEKRDWEPMRAIMTDALFNQMGTQLEGLKARGWTNHVERIAVLDARITRYMQESENDVLVVRLKTRITDYTTDDKSGEIIKGRNDKELFMTYDWKLVRAKDRKTLDAEDLSSISCPNCGAPLSVNQSTRCQYCGTVVTLSDHDWALSAIKGIAQVTGK